MHLAPPVRFRSPTPYLTRVPTKAAPASDLFGPTAPPEPPGASSAARPLADRLRPRTLDEVVGQDHLLGPEGTLTRMLQRG